MSSTARTSAPLLLALCLLGALPLVGACHRAPTEPVDTRPRAIVLVTVDGLVPERLVLFGGTDSVPALEQFAAEGTAWADGWTVDPMTRPAIATYLTGLAPDRHRVRDDRFSRLDGSIPTLTERLSAAGYQTAAFLDSSFLGATSGLLRGFDAVSDPFPAALGAAGWHPAVRPPEEVVTDLAAWFETLEPGTRTFCWLHVSGPLLGQLRNVYTAAVPTGDATPVEESGGPPPLERLNASLERVRRVLEQRGDLDSALVMVTGTLGSILGGGEGAPGLGFSIEEPALDTFVVARWPGATAAWDRERVVWAPDVPATMASAAGVELPPEAEGTSLLEPASSDRTLFAWTWATRDQMGWHAQRAARVGGVKQIEGLNDRTVRLDGSDDPVPSDLADRLRAELDSRAEPAAPAVPLDLVRPVLEARGLTLRPVPSDGRDFGDEASRYEVGQQLLLARHAASRTDMAAAIDHLRAALDIDGDSPIPRLDLSQILARVNPARSAELLVPAVEHYPTDPELLHWYAHAVWQDSWRDAEALLMLIEPFRPQEADVLYDLACTRSLAQDLEASEKYLRRAIDAGFDNYTYMETDPDLRNLRASGRFSEVMRDHR